MADEAAMALWVRLKGDDAPGGADLPREEQPAPPEWPAGRSSASRVSN